MGCISSRGVVLSLVLLGLVPFVGGCGAEIDEAYMAKDSGGNQKATKFHIEGDEIHCIVKFLGGDEETLLKFSVSGTGSLELDQEEIYPRPTSEKQGPIDLDLQIFTLDSMGELDGDGPWPPGKYTMKIAIDDVHDTSLDFTIGD